MADLFRKQELLQTSQQQRQGKTRLLPETVWATDPLPTGAPPDDAIVVTVSRQFGSGGSEIARLVAQESGLRYVDAEILDEVAKRLGVDSATVAQQDEQTTGMVEHILGALQASSPFTVNYTALLSPTAVPQPSNEQAYLHLTQRVVLELAAQGNAVIVGRGSQFLLRNKPRTLHIYIFAPLTQRIANVVRHSQLSASQATRLIEQRDYEHDSYLRRYYGSNGHQPALYHLLINTGLFPFDLAADLIRQSLSLVRHMS